MARPGKKLKPRRTAEEFDARRLLAALAPPLITPAAFAWDMARIRSARDDQLRGVFRQPAQLAKGFRTDDALFTAYRNRLAPLRALDVTLTPASSSAKAHSIAGEAEALYGMRGPALTRDTLSTIQGELVEHGVAFGVIEARARDDGSRVDLYVNPWPIEWVRWDPILRCFVTQVEESDAAEIEREAVADDYRAAYHLPITHGDGRWIVFASRTHEPWAHEACLLPAALVWGARAFAMRDWAKSSYAHGSAKMMGELPEGISLTDGEGNPTPEARAFIELLQALMGGESLAGIRPFGSKSEFIAPTSTNWQVFTELVTNRDRAAARIYLGTDGTLGAQGGAPGVDISALFGIATTILQGDAEIIEQSLYSGLLQPWAAMNFGSSDLAPRRLYRLPDADEERLTESLAARLDAFHKSLRETRENGGVVDQDFVDSMARRFKVPSFALAAAEERTSSLDLTPSDKAKVVRVAEVRGSLGLRPFGDARDQLTLPELDAKAAAAANPEPPPTNGARPNGATASA